MKAKLLNLEESLQMYELIREFIPTEPTTQIDAITKIVKKMGGEKYFKCLELMTGEKKEVLIHATANERVSIFLIGFQENLLYDLPRLKVDGLYV
jgi:hypothetical protein